MALAVSAEIASNLNPNGSSQTLAFNSGGAGTNKWMLLCVTMANTVNFSSATYNGVAMTLVRNTQYSGLSQRQVFYVLENPDINTNDIVVNFSGSQFNNTSIYAVTLTDCGGNGVDGQSGASTSPNSDNLAGVTTGSMIYATGISNVGQSFDYVIDGNNETTEFQGHNVNKIVEGALSAAIVAGGTINIQTKTDSGNITNNHIEMLEFAAGGGGRRRVIII
jgi:hypothetical protein